MEPLFWVAVNIIGLIILIFMYISIDKTHSKRMPEQKLFGCIHIMIMLYLLFDTGMYIIDGLLFPGARFLNYLFSMLYFFVTPLPGLIYLLYCDYKIYNDREGLKRRLRYYLIPVAINTLFVLLTPFTNLVFSIDANNFYIRGGFFWFAMIITYGYVFASYPFLAIKTRNKRALAPKGFDIYLYLFQIPPIVLGIIQLLFRGPLLVGIGFVVSAYFMYTYSIQSFEDRRRLSVRFNNIIIIQFALVSFILITVMLWAFENIMGELSPGFDQSFNQTELLLAFVFIVILFVVFVFSSIRMAQRLIFTPLKLLVDSLHRMKKTQEEKLFGVDRGDEIGLLSNTIQDLFVKGHYDGLTEIYNRRYLEMTLQHLMKTLSRMKSILSVMMVDVDFFKLYNDTYGHSKGDDCLKAIAKTLDNVVERSGDFVARYGGEEFAVILPGTGEAGAQMIADKMLNAVQELKILHEKYDVGIVTVSIGIAFGSPNQKQSWDEYLKKADEALYMSKREGRNRYTFLALQSGTNGTGSGEA